MHQTESRHMVSTGTHVSTSDSNVVGLKSEPALVQPIELSLHELPACCKSKDNTQDKLS